MRQLSLLFVMLIITAVSCGDSATGPEDEDSIFGTYALETINGETLPFTMFEDENGVKVEVISMEITLNSDETFVLTETYRVTQDGEESVDEESYDGTWSQPDSNTILFEGGNEAEIGDNSLTLNVDDQYEFYFVKR